MNLSALDAAITYFQSVGMHTRVDALATLRSQIVLLQARESDLQAWHDAVMGQETVGTYYTSINRRQWFPGKTPFASIPHPVIIRPKPLAKE